MKNPDGSTADHRAAENEYDVDSPFLIYLLAGKVVPGEVMINFVTNGAHLEDGSPCLGTSGCQLSETPGGFWASQPNCTQNPGSCSTNLTPSISTATFTVYTGCAVLIGCYEGPATVNAFELNGSITSQVSNNIGHLESWFLGCSESGPTNTSAATALNPASCIASAFTPGANSQVNLHGFRLTLLDLGNPIAITAGQVVSIKLDISFYWISDPHCVGAPDTCS